MYFNIKRIPVNETGLYSWAVMVKDSYYHEVTEWSKHAGALDWLSSNVEAEDYHYAWMDHNGAEALVVVFLSQGDMLAWLSVVGLKKR